MRRHRRARPPIPPPLPPGQVLVLPGRGEAFVRRAPGPPGAPTVVLLHGWFATADINFFPVLGPLAERYDVVAPDLRGHGRSLIPESGFTIEDAADDVVALLDRLGVEQAVVAGYSLGGAVAQCVAARRPDRVAGLVLSATALRFGGVGRKVFLPFAGWQGALYRLTNGRWLVHRLLDRATRRIPDLEVIRPWLAAEVERGHPGALRDAGRALAAFDGRALAAATADRVPAVVVHTTRDRLVKPRYQRELAQAWRAGVVTLDADHDAPIAAPREFTAAMIDAVERLTAPTIVAGVAG